MLPGSVLQQAIATNCKMISCFLRADIFSVPGISDILPALYKQEVRGGPTICSPTHLTSSGLLMAVAPRIYLLWNKMTDEGEEDLYGYEEDFYTYDQDSLDPSEFLELEPQEVLDQLTAVENDAAFSEVQSISAQQTTYEPVDFNGAVLNNRQRLIVQLFDPVESVRDEARANLRSYWTDDRALIGELVQYSNENPDNHNGIFQTIAVLGFQSDSLLRSNQDRLLSFLAWASQRGYGSYTMEQIGVLRNRCGG